MQIYQGNNDQNSLVINTLMEPIEARFIRLHPYAWYGHISLRMELHGCSLKPGKMQVHPLRQKKNVLSTPPHLGTMLYSKRLSYRLLVVVSKRMVDLLC